MEKIIIFLHFHKCGGSSINKMFGKYKKFKVHKNCNPYRNNKNIIMFWNFKKNQFNKFKNELINNKVEYIALEWNYFKYYNTLDFNNIELITCFRDPYERYISNMRFDNNKDSNKYNNKNIIWNQGYVMQRFFVNYNKFNYYIKMLNGFGNNPDIEVNNKHLKIAKNRLDKFSIILILEDKETFKQLDKFETTKIVKNNINKHNYKIEISREEFIEKNILDYELYEYAKKISYNNI